MASAWLTVAKVAADLGVSAKTIRRRIKATRLPAANLGSKEQPCWRISPEALEGYLRARLNKAEPKTRRPRVKVIRFF